MQNNFSFLKPTLNIFRLPFPLNTIFLENQFNHCCLVSCKIRLIRANLDNFMLLFVIVVIVMTSNKNTSNKLNRMSELLSNWMARLVNTPHLDTPLWQLYIPGSHDSGAYELYPTQGFSIDRPDLMNCGCINYFRRMTYPIISRYSLTQRIDIGQQLRMGIRYLDLRIGFNSNPHSSSGPFYIVHNFYGPPLEHVLNQIRRFLIGHPREVLLLDVQHVHGAGVQENYVQLIQLIFYHLRCYLVPWTGPESVQGLTLRQLWRSGKQVIAFIRNVKKTFTLSQLEGGHLFWPDSQLNSPWANTTSPCELRRYLHQKICTRIPSRLFVTQAVLTPNTCYLLRHPMGSLHHNLALLANQTILAMLKEFSCKQELMNSVSELSVSQCQTPLWQCPNIVMTDFVEWNGFALPNYVVRANFCNGLAVPRPKILLNTKAKEIKIPAIQLQPFEMENSASNHNGKNTKQQPQQWRCAKVSVHLDPAFDLDLEENVCLDMLQAQQRKVAHCLHNYPLG